MNVKWVFFSLLLALYTARIGELILGKFTKTAAIGCHISQLKCTKFDFGSGSVYSAPLNPLAGF